MEEKKLDINSIIGFILIAGILMYMLWQNQPTPEEIAEQEKAIQEQIDAENKANEKAVETFVATPAEFSSTATTDSLQLVNLKNKIGDFAYSASQSSATQGETIIENEVLYLKVNNKGGYLTEVRLKQFTDYDSVPIYLIKDKNSILNITFGTTDNRTLKTQDLYFQPTLTKNGDN